MPLCRWPRAAIGALVVGVCFLPVLGPNVSHGRQTPDEAVEDAPPVEEAEATDPDAPGLLPREAESQPIATSPADASPEVEDEQERVEPAPAEWDHVDTAPVEAAENPAVESDDRALLVDTVPRTSVEAARFSGIQPGTSSLKDVKTAWGEPEDVEQLDAGLTRLQFSQEPFRRIDVLVADDRVESIIVYLARRFPADALAKQLELAEFSPVIVTDENGAWLGESYPERGVLFHFPADADGREVTQVILEPLDPSSFALRAQERIGSQYVAALVDLQVALQLDPQLAHAHWLQARVWADLGRPQAALAACRTAIRLEEDNPRYRFTIAEILQSVGQFAEASAQTNQGIALAGDRTELFALGLLQLGNQIAGGPDRDYQRATEYHMRALKQAEPLVDDPRPGVRRLASQVLVDAHLAVAGDIAWGHWRQKEIAVPKWLERAEDAAGRRIEAGDLPSEYRLRIARQALAAYVGLGGSLDPAPWLERLRQVGAEELHEETDEHRQQRLHWEVGVALYDTMQTCHQRSEHDKALQYGAAAVSYLESGSAGRETTATDAYLLGRLYFRVGSIYAIQHGDHRQAINWFDKATPLLNQPVPDSALADVGRQGESLVSMAVSYWEGTRYDQAVQLTERGVELMEQAVNQGILDSHALAVPYGNLANMHRHLGNAGRADHYVKLASATEPIDK